MVAQRAPPVEAGHHLRAAVVHGGVGEGQPDGEVLLGLHEGVAVVLVPREATGLLGLLVDGLVPVEPGVGAHQVGHHAHQVRVRHQPAQDRGPGCQVDAERDGAGLGDGQPPAVEGGEERLGLGVEAVDGGGGLGQEIRGHQVGEHHVAVPVERRHLLGGEGRRRAGVVGPGEPARPRVRLECWHRVPLLVTAGCPPHRTVPARPRPGPGSVRISGSARACRCARRPPRRSAPAGILRGGAGRRPATDRRPPPGPRPDAATTVRARPGRSGAVGLTS